jgi:hypothetical protein
VVWGHSGGKRVGLLMAEIGIVDWLRSLGRGRKDGPWPLCHEAADEIERLRADKAAISQTASDYLHEIERLKSQADNDEYEAAERSYMED